MSQRLGSKPFAGLLALSLTSGTLAGLGVLTAAPASATAGPVCTQPTQTYAAGSAGSYVVPAGATTVQVVASGAAAVAGRYNGSGGAGARVSTTLTVTPGEVLDYAVGTSGDQSNGGLSGASPSGGRGSSYGYFNGSGGAGATFVNNAGTLLVAAGGGGGAGFYSNGGSAGPASLTSTSGVFAGGDGHNQDGMVAHGGSATVGAGAPVGNSGGAGYSGNGQVGGGSGDYTGAGGGGGGYKGGGGSSFGQNQPGGGGAGSSYAVAPYTIIANGSTGSLTLSAPVDPVFQSATSTAFNGGQAGTFTVCAPGGPGSTLTRTGALPTGVTFVDNGNGTATLAGTATQLGSFPLTFTATSSVTTETQSFTLTVNDITAKTLQVSASPTTVSAGDTVAVTVTAYDAQGAVATTDQDTLAWSSTDLQAVFPSAHLVNGTATVNVTVKSAGTQTITATDATGEGLISQASNAFTVAPIYAISFTVDVPTGTVAGQTAMALITAYDPYGNVATGDTTPVHLTSSDSSAVLSPDFALTNGVATKAFILTQAGAQTVTATDTAISFITGSGGVLVSAAPASMLVLTTATSSIAGSSNTVTVDPQDPYGNSTTLGDVLHFSSTDAQAILPSDGPWSSSVSATLGTAGTQTITVSDLTDTDVASGSQTVTVIAGVARHVATHSGDQQTARARHDFGSPLSVLVTDLNGNPVAGQQVRFAVPVGSDATIGGAATDAVISNSNGIATSGVLTAGSTPGSLTVTATNSAFPVQPRCAGACPRMPIANGSTSFTETVTASDATAAAAPVTSSGTGTATQSVTVPVPAGGSITLLDASGQPVTQVVTAQGTYTLDPTTGVITFVAVTGFSGTPTTVTFQVTDAYNLAATGTYTPNVTPPAPGAPPSNPVAAPVGAAKVVTAAHTVLTGSTFSATCTVSVGSLTSCRTSLTTHVAGRQVVVGTSTVVKAKAGAKTVTTVVRLNKLGRTLAAQVGGVPVTVWASVVKVDGRALSAKKAATLVDKHVRVASALFPTKAAALTAPEKHRLKGIRAQLGAVKVITCVGYTDSVGDPAANVALGKARAQAVCHALARHGVKLVVVTRGLAHPVGSNATEAGRALNRRVEISLTY